MRRFIISEPPADWDKPEHYGREPDPGVMAQI
jgi:hypothetical protein